MWWNPPFACLALLSWWMSVDVLKICKNGKQCVGIWLHYIKRLPVSDLLSWCDFHALPFPSFFQVQRFLTHQLPHSIAVIICDVIIMYLTVLKSQNVRHCTEKSKCTLLYWKIKMYVFIIKPENIRRYIKLKKYTLLQWNLKKYFITRKHQKVLYYNETPKCKLLCWNLKMQVSEI